MIDTSRAEDAIGHYAPPSIFLLHMRARAAMMPIGARLFADITIFHATLLDGFRVKSRRHTRRRRLAYLR